MGSDRRRAIRNMLAHMGMHVTPQQITAALEEIGIEVSEHFVVKVREQMLREQAMALREQSKRPPVSKARKRPQQRKIPRGGRGR